jgi:hypothetical protein
VILSSSAPPGGSIEPASAADARSKCGRVGPGWGRGVGETPDLRRRVRSAETWAMLNRDREHPGVTHETRSAQLLIRRLWVRVPHGPQKPRSERFPPLSAGQKSLDRESVAPRVVVATDLGVFRVRTYLRQAVGPAWGRGVRAMTFEAVVSTRAVSTSAHCRVNQ